MTQERAQTLIDLAEEHGFEIWSAVGGCFRGTALVGMGRIGEGLPLIENGIRIYRGLKSPPVFLPVLLYFWADAYGAAGRPADGLGLLMKPSRLRRRARVRPWRQSSSV